MAHLALAGGEPIRHTSFPRWPCWNHEEVEAVQAVVASGRWGAQQGGEVHRFEDEFAAYQEAAHGIAVTNGTVALKLALTAAGVGLGDEVIMPGYTFVATATAALEIGAVPVFADIDPHTYTLDPASAAGVYHVPHPGALAGASRRSASRHGGHHGPGPASQSGGH